MNKCSQWQKPEERSLRFYALRNYAAHLYEAKQWKELFALARNSLFRRTQEQAFPHNPNLILQPLQLALRGAMEIDDAAGMTEFIFLRACIFENLKKKMPLEDLRAGRMDSACQLADHHEPVQRIIWYLLFVWELADNQQINEAKELLERLSSINFPSLTDTQSRAVASLLAVTANIWTEKFKLLYISLLTKEGQKLLCEMLIERENFGLAEELAQTLGDYFQSKIISAIATTRLGKTPSDFGDLLDRARKLNYAKIEALSDLANAQAESGDKSGAKQTVLGISEVLKSDDWDVDRKLALAYAKIGYFAEALDHMKVSFADSFSLPNDVEILCEIAKEQLKSGDKDDGQKSLNNALSLAKGIANSVELEDIQGQYRAKALNSVAAAQCFFENRTVAAEIFTAAINAALKINYDTEQYDVLKTIAITQAQTGFVKDSLQTLKKIIKVDPTNAAIRGIALAQAHANDYQGALNTARKNYDFWELVAVICEASVVQSVNENSSLVREEIAKDLLIEQKNVSIVDKEKLIKTVGSAMAKAKAFSKAAEAVSDEFFYLKEDNFRVIAVEQAKAGYLSEAQESLKKYLGGGWELATDLISIAQECAKRNNMEIASKLLEKAVIEAKEIGNPYYAVETLCEIAVAQAKYEGIENARKTLALAFEIVKRITFNDGDQKAGLAQLAVAQTQIGDISRGKATFDEAEKIQADFTQSMTIFPFESAVSNLAKIGWIQEAKEFASHTKSPLLKAISLGEIAKGFAAKNQPILASENFAESVVQALEIPNENVCSETLSKIACNQVFSGFYEEAMRTSQMILANRSVHLVKIAKAFAEMRTKDNFMRIVISCSATFTSAFELCGILAELYPEQNEEIAILLEEYTKIVKMDPMLRKGFL